MHFMKTCFWLGQGHDFLGLGSLLAALGSLLSPLPSSAGLGITRRHFPSPPGSLSKSYSRWGILTERGQARGLAVLKTTHGRHQRAQGGGDALLRASWSDLGGSWGGLGSLLGALGPLLVDLGSLLGDLEAVLGRSWSLLGCSWSPLTSTAGLGLTRRHFPPPPFSAP